MTNLQSNPEPSLPATGLASGSTSLSGSSRSNPAELPVLFRVPKVPTRVAPPAPPPPMAQAEVAPAIKNESPVLRESLPAPTTVAAPITQEKTPPATKSTEPAASGSKVTRASANAQTKTPAAGSWFDNQGKLITVCFLLALAATIYFARSKREREVANPALADTATSLEVTLPGEDDASPAVDAEEDLVRQETPVKQSAREIAIARRKAAQAAAAASQADVPRADLLPPMDLSAPPLVKGPGPQPPADPNQPPVAPQDPREQTRVAEVPQDRTAPRAGGWNGGQMPAVAPGATAPPAGYPANPPSGGSYPSTGMPAYPPASASGYPSTDAAPYRYYVPPTGTNGPSAPLPPGNEPNNERSGSGLY